MGANYKIKCTTNFARELTTEVLWTNSIQKKKRKLRDYSINEKLEMISGKRVTKKCVHKRNKWMTY